MRSEFDAVYTDRADRFAASPQWRSDMAHIIEKIVAARPKRHLDYGCSTGRFVASLLAECGQQFDVRGVDLNNDAIDKAVRQHGLHFHHSPEPETLFVDFSFDSVSLLYVLSHVDDPDFTLSHLYRILDRGGRLYVMVPNRLFDLAMWPHNRLTGYKPDPTIKHHWTMTTLTQLLQHHGFAIMETDRRGEVFRYLPIRCLRAYNLVVAKKPFE